MDDTIEGRDFRGSNLAEQITIYNYISASTALRCVSGHGWKKEKQGQETHSCTASSAWLSCSTSGRRLLATEDALKLAKSLQHPEHPMPSIK
jgi:hypothetical protein